MSEETTVSSRDDRAGFPLYSDFRDRRRVPGHEPQDPVRLIAASRNAQPLMIVDPRQQLLVPMPLSGPEPQPVLWTAQPLSQAYATAGCAPVGARAYCQGGRAADDFSYVPVRRAPVLQGRHTSAACVAAVCLGIGGLVIPFACVGAVITGLVGLSECRRDPGGVQGKEMAISGLVLGTLVTLFWTLLMFAIALGV